MRVTQDRDYAGETLLNRHQRDLVLLRDRVVLKMRKCSNIHDMESLKLELKKVNKRLGL